MSSGFGGWRVLIVARDEDRPLAALVEFAQRLRHAGIPLGSDQVVNYCQAVAWAGVTDLGDLYWAGRACLVTSGDQIPLYDAAFDAVFRGVQRIGLEPDSSGDAAGDSMRGIGASDAAGDEGDGGARAVLLASGAEGLRDKDFSKLSSAERRELEVAIARLRLTPPLRRSHRTRPVRRGDYLDLRRTIRRAMRTHGEIVHRSWRRCPDPAAPSCPAAGRVRIDVRLRTHACSSSRMPCAALDARVEIFCFGTRITRVTEPLRHRDPDAALAAVTVEVVDWDGGTRIGASIDEFMRRWGRAGLARDSLLIICSDGLERGEPAALAAHMERLARLTHRIVWVNPLKGDAQYQPLARGMAAALPHIDYFLAGHSLGSLEELSEVLADIASVHSLFPAEAR